MSSQILDVRKIRKLFDKADDAINRFNATNGPLINWNGQQVKALNEEAFQLLSDLCGLAATPSELIHEQAVEIVLALDDFARAFADYQTRSAAMDETCHPAGTMEMWNAFFVLRRSIYEPTTFAPLESIDILLNKQRVPIQQIAKIYGFVSSNGSPDVHKVEEELANPGTHTGGDWLPPVEMKHRQEIAQRWAGRSPVMDFLDSTQQNSFTRSAEAPESLETLIRQRVPIMQILKMKPGLTREDVEQSAVEMGVMLPDAKYKRPDANTAEANETGQSKPVTEAKQSSKQVAKLVRDLRSQGKSSEEISLVVAEKFPGADVSGVLVG
ncbi:MAG: hypothetical protein KF752_11800 [Pirellulaceae bacterium]|nr:hypothetical protein [Pirellulaceae bacterium]